MSMTKRRNCVGRQVREVHAKVGEVEEIAKVTLDSPRHARGIWFRVDGRSDSRRHLGCVDSNGLGFV